MSQIDAFKKQLTPVTSLIPRIDKKRHVAQPSYTRRVVTIAGIKTVKTRFLPVSHEGQGIETPMSPGRGSHVTDGKPDILIRPC